jgi:putative tryptophan/tyrosine transport system substrate-binding protein
MQFDQLKRREFITLVGGAAAWPLAARAQQPAMPVIGYLNAGSPDLASDSLRLRAFRQGLSETGYVEGRNMAIEFRWAGDQYDRLPALAADLVRRQVTVIVANGPSGPVAKAATTTIPIVFVTVGDPVAFGLVASLNKPGGSVTGVTTLSSELGPKRLELLHEMVPTATVIAALIRPTGSDAETQSRGLQAAARTMGLELHILHASTERELDAVFATVARMRAGALVIGTDVFFDSRNKELAALAARHAVPMIYQSREFAAAGGVMSYGGSMDPYRLAGVYTGRILKGEKPADLSVQQSTKVELIINLKTAKALGLTVPLALVASADELIE